MTPQPKPSRKIETPYLRFVKQHVCYELEWFIETGEILGECIGGMDPHHAKEKGFGKMGSKPDDRESVPACRGHHMLAERHPNKFREFFRRMKMRLQREYDDFYKPKPPVRGEKPARVKARIEHCASCHQTHDLPWRKIRLVKESVFYRCPVSNDSVEART